MRSPLHPDAELLPKEIEPGFSAYECPVSGGYWVPLQAYEQWMTRHPKHRDILCYLADTPKG